MCEADVVVSSSYVESFGIILLEAMSLKKPIVASCSGGVSEIITDHVDGILVNPRDAKGLAKAILELLDDSQMTTSIGFNAFETVKKRYDTSKVASKFIEFMENND